MRRPSGSEKWWFADAATLRANDFNLSAGRYRPMSQAQVEHRDPRELLDELAAIEVEIAEDRSVAHGAGRAISMTVHLRQLGDICEINRACRATTGSATTAR